MDPRRLRLLVELSHRGTMRAVADATGYATSAVSQQLAVLEREAGIPLLEPAGRNVRLTPAGYRLVRHAEEILAALERARAELGGDAEPAGLLRIASYSSALSEALVPAVRALSRSHPGLRLELQEREPDEVIGLLGDNAVDLGVIYDYSLAPRELAANLMARPLWRGAVGLGVPHPAEAPDGGPGLLLAHRDAPWIVNSRQADDEIVVRALCGLAGFAPRIGHRADSLDLVQDMIAAGLGVGLLPQAVQRKPGVTVQPLTAPPVTLRSYAVTRSGHDRWPPAALIIDLLARHSASAGR
jgi:DNA-binding transcriptional LysR family regulator